MCMLTIGSPHNIVQWFVNDIFTLQHNSCTREVSNCSATDTCSYKGSTCIKNCTVSAEKEPGSILDSDNITLLPPAKTALRKRLHPQFNKQYRFVAYLHSTYLNLMISYCYSIVLFIYLFHYKCWLNTVGGYRVELLLEAPYKYSMEFVCAYSKSEKCVWSLATYWGYW